MVGGKERENGIERLGGGENGVLWWGRDREERMGLRDGEREKRELVGGEERENGVGWWERERMGLRG